MNVLYPLVAFDVIPRKNIDGKSKLAYICTMSAKKPQDAGNMSARQRRRDINRSWRKGRDGQDRLPHNMHLVLAEFDNNVEKLAEALDITPQAIYAWGKFIPELQCYKIEDLTKPRVLASQLNPKCARRRRKLENQIGLDGKEPASA